MAESDQILFDKVDKMECPSCKMEIDVAALEPFSKAACPACGAELTVPARLATYRLDDCLGSGGMGSVYKAYDETLARTVAVKVMRKSLGDQPEFLESFRREAQAAAKLNHPNIAQIYSFGEEKGQPYIVMEFVPGKHLDKMIESPEMLPLPLVMKIGMDVADGLQLAAASNLIHGDIKPENILLDDRGAAKLVDFGIASSPDEESTEIWGTPYYISPEKIKRERIDFRSDMYCLGGTLYHAIGKHPPFDGEDAMAVVKARLTSAPRPLHDLRGDVDPDVEKIVMRMLELDPARRYPSYGALMDDIRQYLTRVQPQQVASSSGGASKRIVIKGRGATRARLQAAGGDAQPPPAAPAPEEAEEAAPKRKGIVIAKKHGKLTVPAADAEAEEAGAEEEPPKKKGGVGKIIAIVLAILVVVGGGVVGGLFYLSNKHKQDSEARFAELFASQNSHLKKIQAIYGNTFKLASGRIADAAKSADEIVAQAVAAVEREVGVEFTSRIMQEEIEEEEPFDDSLDDDLRGVDVDSDAEDGEAAAEDGEAETSGDGEKGEAADGEKGEAADGEKEGGSGDEKAEAADGDKAEDAGGDAGASEEATGEAAAAEDGEAAAASEDGGDGTGEEATGGDELEGLPAMAREIFVMLAPVRKAQRLATRACDSVSGLLERAVAATNVTEGAAFSVAEKEVGENIDRLKKIAAKASERYGALDDSAADLEKIVKEAKGKLDEMSVEATKMAAERERVAAEEKAAEEARLERERKEAEEAARKAAEDAEIAKVRAVVTTHYADLAAFKFEPVFKDLDALEGTLTFKSAQRALKGERRRVNGIKDLKEFLIKNLSGEKKFTHPRDKWSVVSVDARKIEVLPAKPKPGTKPTARKWETLQPEQIVPMLLFYIGDKDKAESILLRDRVKAYIDAAIYCVTMRGDNENARALAKHFCEMAIADLPSKRKEISETLYELSFEENDEEE